MDQSKTGYKDGSIIDYMKEQLDRYEEGSFTALAWCGEELILPSIGFLDDYLKHIKICEKCQDIIRVDVENVDVEITDPEKGDIRHIW